MFISVADMVEDIMQASLPGFIDSVKLSDIGQGTNPVRIVAMRGLPDQPGDKQYPREEWIDQGKSQPKYTPEQEEQMKREGTWVEGNSTDDQSGDYVVRITFSFMASLLSLTICLKIHRIWKLHSRIKLSQVKVETSSERRTSIL